METITSLLLAAQQGNEQAMNHLSTISSTTIKRIYSKW